MTSTYIGKRALVTGGSTGIGFEAARLLIEGGATVALLARRPETLNVACGSLGPKAFAEPADVARPAALGDAIARVGARLGGIDFLFVNAGMSDAPPVAELTESSYDAIMDVNVRGAIFTIVGVRTEEDGIACRRPPHVKIENPLLVRVP